MTSAPRECNGNLNNNGSLGKCKKVRENRGSYLKKWLDKNMQQFSAPSVETYESYLSGNAPTWAMPATNGRVAPDDPSHYKYGNGYGCAPEPVSLPTYPSFYSAQSPFNTMMINTPTWGPDITNGCSVRNTSNNIQVQRPRQKRNHNNKANFINGVVHGDIIRGGDNDFASLPPMVNSIPDAASNSDMNVNDKEDSCNRRFSDPCLPRLQHENSSDSEDDSVLYSDAIGNKLMMCLMDQINALKHTNERLTKDLVETRAELQSMKQQRSMWHNADSQANMTHSPLSMHNNNGMITSTMSYTPGMLTDLVREIREAARMREEALYTKVRTMIEERSFNTSGVIGSLEKNTEISSLDDIKAQLRGAEAEKRRMNERLLKLEDELHNSRANHNSSELSSLSSCGGGAAGVAVGGAASDAERLRRELRDTRRAKDAAEDQNLKLERLITQMRSKFNGLSVGAPQEETRRAPESPHAQPAGLITLGPVTDL